MKTNLPAHGSAVGDLHEGHEGLPKPPEDAAHVEHLRIGAVASSILSQLDQTRVNKQVEDMYTDVHTSPMSA